MILACVSIRSKLILLNQQSCAGISTYTMMHNNKTVNWSITQIYCAHTHTHSPTRSFHELTQTKDGQTKSAGNIVWMCHNYLVNIGSSHKRLLSPNTSCMLLYRPRLKPFLSGPPIRKIGVRNASVGRICDEQTKWQLMQRSNERNQLESITKSLTQCGSIERNQINVITK